jgi:hypothetical protein
MWMRLTRRPPGLVGCDANHRQEGGLGAEQTYVPPLLAVGAVHHRLIEKGLRMKASLIVETGQSVSQSASQGGEGRRGARWMNARVTHPSSACMQARASRRTMRPA